MEWSQRIQEYAKQVNSGAHQSISLLSPFEVFFGRRPNDNNFIEHESDFDDDGIADESSLETWMDDYGKILERADRSQRKASDAMKRRHAAKYPPSQYQIGEEVIIKEQFMGKKIKSKNDNRIHKAKILDKNGDR